MKKIGICPNVDKDTTLSGTLAVIRAVYGKAELFMSECFAQHFGDEFNIHFVKEASLYEETDIITVLGGDGTVLKAARACAKAGTELIGINLGRVGYMAELELDELYLLERVVNGDYTVEHRMMLDVKNGDFCDFALNDSVIGSSSLFDMAEIELYCNGKLVNRYRSNGLIASTPTGSTAYSLSAGGAVLDPSMNAIITTPISSHSLNATPIVFSADSMLTLKNICRSKEALVLSLDGRKPVKIPFLSSVTVTKSNMTADFIKLKDGGFYNILRTKMAEK